MNTTELDVSDIPQDRILRLRDPISGIVVPAMSTHENKDLLRQIGKDVCLRFGFHVPPKEADDEARRAQRIEAYKGTVPHWWVAVIVEGTCGEVTERRMVHLDVCGAAYDDTAFRMHEGAPVSLQVFATSEYDLVPAKMFGKSIGGEDLSHKFVMTSSTTGPGNRKYCSLHPLSVRHLRCFHWKEKVGVEVTPVDTFIKRNMRGFPGCYDRWLDTVVQLQHKFLLRAPAGTEVIVCKLQKRRDLNGKKAVVHASNSTGAPTDRIPVLVEGLPNPVSIKPSCARLPSKRAYSSFDELLSRVDAVNKLPAELPKPLSRKTRASLQKRLAADAELRDAMEKLTSGKVTISYYGDAEFVRGIRRLSEPPFDALLPASMIASIRDGLEVADHPQAEAVFAILKVCRSAKLKALQRDPGLVRGGGGVAISEECELFRLLQSVAKKIRASAGLMEVFEAMDRKGLFHNPVRKVG